MTQLAFDFDDLDTPEWTPIIKSFGLDLRDLIRDERCRDCGVKCGYNQGGTSTIGIYTLCDDCARIDTCRPSTHQPDHHVSHWGETHPADEHDALVAKREGRRARYLKQRTA